MDYLQYKNYEKISISIRIQQSVLNLVINELPSIPEIDQAETEQILRSFKPCYKWITFNTTRTSDKFGLLYIDTVLNLVINGLPSIPTSR